MVDARPTQSPLDAKAYRAFHEELSRHTEHGDEAYTAAIRAYLASQEAAAPSEELAALVKSRIEYALAAALIVLLAYAQWGLEH